MSDFFEQLETQLHKAARAELGAGRKFRRRWRLPAPTLGALATSAAVLVVIAVAVVALTSLGHRHATPPQGPPPGGTAQAIYAHALKEVQKRGRSCGSGSGSPHAGMTNATPSQALLSLYGVLRQPPVSADEGFARGFAGRLRLIVYSRFVRHTRTVNGTTYYLVPVAFQLALSGRCYSEVNAVLANELPSLAPRVRAQVLAIEAHENSHLTNAHPLCLIGLATGPGAEFGGYECTLHGLNPMLGAHGQLVYGTVPDGVATVTLRYPKKGSITVRPVNNVLAVLLHWPLTWLPRIVVWKSASGATIKTFEVGPKATANWFNVSFAAG